MAFKTPIDGLVLRFAREEDTRLILEFIMQLAEYEKLRHEVTADEETLRNTLFGKRTVAEVVLAYFDSQPAGFALFFYNFSTFLGKPGIYIEDLFVKPRYRGRGFGRALLKFIAGLAIERKCGRVEWWVLDWNRDAIGFYQKIGAEAMNEWTVFRLSGKNLMELAG